MNETLRVGTRRSPLALGQTAGVLRALHRHHPGTTFQAVPITTGGDRNRTTARVPDLTDRLSAAVETGEVDLAVHSAKDLPLRPERDVRVSAFLRRSDPSDVLVGRTGRNLPNRSTGARIGVSSARRRAQLLRHWPQSRVFELRGTTAARLQRLDPNDLDAVLLASSALPWTPVGGRPIRRLPLTQFLPSPGQGTLAVEIRYGDLATDRIVRSVDHGPTRATAIAERTCASALGAVGDLAFGVLARVRGENLSVDAELLDPEGTRAVRVRRTGPVLNAASLGRLTGADLLRQSESGTPRSSV